MAEHRSRLHRTIAMLAVLLWLGQAGAQESASAHAPSSAQLPVSSATASSVQFPQVPLRRDIPEGVSMLESLGWSILLLALAGAGWLVARRKLLLKPTRPGLRASTPMQMGRTSLTAQASVHAVEWGGEEILLGCTAHTITLLARRTRHEHSEPAVRDELKRTA